VLVGTAAVSGGHAFRLFLAFGVYPLRCFLESAERIDSRRFARTSAREKCARSAQEIEDKGVANCKLAAKE
jgi:hypothetical protein